MVRDVRLINANLRADKVDKKASSWIVSISSLPYLYCNEIVIIPSELSLLPLRQLLVGRLRWPADSRWGGPAAKGRSAGHF